MSVSLLSVSLLSVSLLSVLFIGLLSVSLLCDSLLSVSLSSVSLLSVSLLSASLLSVSFLSVSLLSISLLSVSLLSLGLLSFSLLSVSLLSVSLLALLICPGIKLLISITCSIRYLQLPIQNYCKHLIIEAGFHNIATREKRGICGARNLCTSEYIGYTTPIKIISEHRLHNMFKMQTSKYKKYLL